MPKSAHKCLRDTSAGWSSTPKRLRGGSARRAARAVALTEKVDQDFELGRHVDSARVVQKVAWKLGAVLVEHAQEALLGYELIHHALEHVCQSEPKGRGIHQDRAVVGDDAPVDRDLEVLAVLDELPAIDGAARDLS